MSNIDDIISQLETDRTAIDRAISALREISQRTRSSGRGTSSGSPATAAPKKRHMSAAGRRRISEAARKRWADLKKSKEQGQAPSARKSTAKKRGSGRKAGRKSAAKKTAQSSATETTTA